MTDPDAEAARLGQQRADELDASRSPFILITALADFNQYLDSRSPANGRGARPNTGRNA